MRKSNTTWSSTLGMLSECITIYIFYPGRSSWTLFTYYLPLWANYKYQSGNYSIKTFWREWEIQGPSHTNMPDDSEGCMKGNKREFCWLWGDKHLPWAGGGSSEPNSCGPVQGRAGVLPEKLQHTPNCHTPNWWISNLRPKIITQYQSQSLDTPQDFPGSEREIPEALGTRMCPSRCQMAISITVISKLKLRLMALVP